MLYNFLSTREPTFLYKYIVEPSKNNCEKLYSKKLNLLIFKKKNLPSLHYIFFYIYIIFSGKIFKNNRSRINFNNIEIGRFVISNTFYTFDTYVNKLKFYKLLIKNFYLAGLLIKSCNYYYNKYKISGIYIDHCGYLNGIIFSFFAQKKIAIYTNNYPHGIYFVDYKNNKKQYLLKYENSLRINIKKKINSFQRIKARNKLISLVKNKNYIPWLSKLKFKKLKEKIDYNNFDYVIYTHSFTDGQMWYGNDGFENTLEWLEFTLNAFIGTGKKILIKPHPNFYNNTLAEYAIWDKKIYNIVVKKYEQHKNFYFLRNPIHNYLLLKKLNKNCIAISKFGSVILEVSYMNLRSISSSCTFYNSKFKISNMWKNKINYLKLLKKSHLKLKKPIINDLYKLIYSLFYVYPSCYHTSNYYENIIKKNLRLTQSAYDSIFLAKARSKNYKKEENFKKLSKKNNISIIDDLSKKIWQVRN